MQCWDRYTFQNQLDICIILQALYFFKRLCIFLRVFLHIFGILGNVHIFKRESYHFQKLFPCSFTFPQKAYSGILQISAAPLRAISPAHHASSASASPPTNAIAGCQALFHILFVCPMLSDTLTAPALAAAIRVSSSPADVPNFAILLTNLLPGRTIDGIQN